MNDYSLGANEMMLFLPSTRQLANEHEQNPSLLSRSTVVTFPSSMHGAFGPSGLSSFFSIVLSISDSFCAIVFKILPCYIL